MTTIAILGTGLMSKALGAGWSRVGHTVRIGTRSPEKISTEDLGFTPAFVGTQAEAVRSASVVVLAVPFAAAAPLASELKNDLTGKTIIDISNPFDSLADNRRAGAEFTADALGTTAGLVAAFKDNFAATVTMDRPADGYRADVKMAGDDDAAKAIVAELAEDLDHRVIDCGPLHNARLIDGMVSLMLQLDEKYCGFTMKTGWRFFGIPESDHESKE